MELNNDVYNGYVFDKRLSKPIIKFECYRYAPENFRAWRLTKTKVGMEYSPVKGTGRIGHVLLNTGENAAVAELKRLVRKQDRRPKMFRTYGFRMDNDRNRYVFFQGIKILPDYPLERRYVEYKRIIEQLDDKGWEEGAMTKANLGAGYSVESVTEVQEKIDKTKPVIINLYVV